MPNGSPGGERARFRHNAGAQSPARVLSAQGISNPGTEGRKTPFKEDPRKASRTWDSSAGHEAGQQDTVDPDSEIKSN